MAQDPTEAGFATRVKVGVFVALGIAGTIAATILVNDRPYWWRGCELVHISIDDATGLKSKSPVRSLGLQIGYLSAIGLSGTQVKLGICVTAPVEMLPETRAYIRAEGFLGDKFVELKPVKYVGDASDSSDDAHSGGHKPPQPRPKHTRLKPAILRWMALTLGARIAEAQDAPTVPAAGATADPGVVVSPEAPEEKRPVPRPRSTTSREIPVGQTQDVQALVKEMGELTTNLKSALDPEELKKTMRQLNQALENASKALSPQGNLSTTAQRALSKLEDSIEQARDLITRINKGEGSLGMLINDPIYAQEVRDALRNINHLLGKIRTLRLVVGVGAWYLPALQSARGFVTVSFYPQLDRYYKLGIELDPRGRRSDTTTTRTTTSTAANGATSVQTEVREESKIEYSTFVLTALLGKVFWNRLDLSAGILHGDGAVSVGGRLFRELDEDRIQLLGDLYFRGRGQGFDARGTLQVRPWWTVQLFAGLESVRQVSGKLNYFAGAGLTFDDEDIKFLLVFK